MLGRFKLHGQAPPRGAVEPTCFRIAMPHTLPSLPVWPLPSASRPACTAPSARPNTAPNGARLWRQSLHALLARHRARQQRQRFTR